MRIYAIDTEDGSLVPTQQARDYDVYLEKARTLTAEKLCAYLTTPRMDPVKSAAASRALAELMKEAGADAIHYKGWHQIVRRGNHVVIDPTD